MVVVDGGRGHLTFSILTNSVQVTQGSKANGAYHFFILTGLFLLDYLQSRDLEVSKAYLLAPKPGFRDSVSLLRAAQ